MTDPGNSTAATVQPTTGIWIGPVDSYDPTALNPHYIVTNVGPTPLLWSAQLSEPWLTFSEDSQGQLDAGQSTDVGVDIDAFAAVPSGPGPAVGHVSFLDSASGKAFADRTISVDSSFAGGGDSGWTAFAPSADTRTIYVSSSTGNDALDGSSEANAMRTIAASKVLLRHGYPDWLLLKRGDAWHEGLGKWVASGRSEHEPMLVAAYGTAEQRPQLLTGTQDGIWTDGGSGSPQSVDNIAVVGLHFRADGYAGNGLAVGARLLLPSSHVLIEDCMFEAYATNVVFQGFGGRHADFRLRRSVIVDAFATHDSGVHPQGLYAYAVDGLLIEENVFDHNGWSESTPNAGADIYSHNLYIDNGNTGVALRGNIIANGSSHGAQMRSGGVAVDNLFVRNSIGLSVGGGNNPEPSGVTADVHKNVFLEGKDIDQDTPRGWALWLGNISAGSVTGNVAAHNKLGSLPSALALEADCSGDAHACIGVHELVIAGNVFYNWGGNVTVQGSGAEVTMVLLHANDVQDLVHTDPLIAHSSVGSVMGLTSSDNSFFLQHVDDSDWTIVEQSFQSLSTWMALVGDVTSSAQQVLYVDPGRSLGAYNGLIGGPQSLDAFMAGARLQSATTWRTEYTAAQVNTFIRDGFVHVAP